MPIRFRKSFNIFPGVRANVSKSGVSFTVGKKGYHLNFSNRGVKQTVGLPGSGLSQSTYLVKNDPDDDEETEEKQATVSKKKKRTARKRTQIETLEDTQIPVTGAQAIHRRVTPAWVFFIALVVIYLGALVLGLIPANFLSQVLRTLFDWTRSIGL